MVRIDTLISGTKFTCVQQKHWTFIRRHGAHSGAYIVEHESGKEDCFAGCAMVFLGWI